ncbi:hsp70 family protein [Anaeramoeba flamelloides]|uniref:Hsp70 family protein n=1 Tax=Anaeramoeba flamelloides TaxID=1746091 RepID=A0ABQ8X2A0_9EUKA|nr:hsp70 family protein [Anaeramoeba flamelloides]
MTEKNSYKVVVGIDFGTSRSGFAWGFVGDKREEIHGHSDWADYKTDSAILLLKEGEGDMNQGAKLVKIHSFGETAIRDYCNMREDQELRNKYELFRYYKMALYRKEDNVKSVEGNLFPVLDVFSFALQMLKQISTEYMNKFLPSKISEEKIRWVITLPAIWSEEAKSIMRKCAYQGTLIDNEDSKQLILIHEPEAAAIEGYIGAQKIVDEEVFKKGKVMILDAGSGTIDITILDIDKYGNDQKNIKILIPAQGGSMGSGVIDKKFIEFIGKFLEREDLDNIGDFGDLFDSWIIAKHRINNRSPKERIPVKFSIPESLLGNKTLKEYVSKWNQGKTKKNDADFISVSPMNRSAIKISKKYLHSFFEEPVNQVIDCVKQIFVKHKDLNDIQNIFMVGSYSNSQVLETRVRETFEAQPYNIKVLKGTNPGRAIVCGAVRYGLNPSTIRSRTYAYNYGLNWYPRFNPKKHKQSKKLEIQGNELCKDCFQPLIKKNIPIDSNYVSPKEYSTVGNHLMIEIYRSNIEMDPDTVYYIDDNGFEKFGSTLIENIKEEGDKIGNITIEFKFGGTMIEIEVTNKKTNQSFPAQIKYGTNSLN